MESYCRGREPVSVGCKKHDNCFTCPFKECLSCTEDMQVPERRRKESILLPHIDEIKAMHQKGYSYTMIGRHFDVSRQNVAKFFMRHLKGGQDDTAAS